MFLFSSLSRTLAEIFTSESSFPILLITSSISAAFSGEGNLIPAAYWYPSFGVNMNHDPGFYYGKQKLQLIKGITYNIDFAHSDLVLNCSTDPLYYGSTFNFSMLANGKIDLYDRNNISAKTSGNKISFNTIMVSLSPQEISGGEPLLINKPNAAAIKIIKNTSLPFIKGTVNYVYWYNSEGKMKYFHFLPM